MLDLIQCRIIPGHPNSPGFDWPDHRSGAWRVRVCERALLIPFARKSDAEMAQLALEAAGLNTAEAIKAAGGPAVRRIMIDALAW